MIDDSKRVGEAFQRSFGLTPLSQRLDDILGEALELTRAGTISELKDECGDLLCSVLALCHESGWNPRELTDATLEKIGSRHQQYVSMGRKYNVGILGGSFNPVTTSHVSVARLALRAGKLDEVWLMPTYEHMYQKPLLPAEHRMAMLDAALENEKMIKPFYYEIEKKMKGRMLHVMNNLMSDPDYSSYRFTLVVGRDVADDIQNWEGGMRITERVSFLVMDRKRMVGDPVPTDAWYLQSPHRYISDDSDGASQTSSTEAREAVRVGMDTTGILHPGVRRYIDVNRLYQS